MAIIGNWINGDMLEELAKEEERGDIGILVMTWDQTLETAHHEGFFSLRLTRLFRSTAMRFSKTTGAAFKWLVLDDGLLMVIRMARSEWAAERDEALTRLLFELRETAVQVFSAGKRTRKLRGKDRICGGAALIRRQDEGTDGHSAAGDRDVDLLSALLRAWRMAVTSSPCSFEIFECRKQAVRWSRERIGVRYAPIVSMQDGSLFAYEALPFNKATAEVWTPEQFFSVSEWEGELFDNDRYFREQAILAAPSGSTPVKLFVPVPAWIVFEPKLHPGDTLSKMEAAGLRPEQVVLTLVDNGTDHPGTLVAALRHYRMQGFRIALSAVGTDREAIERLIALKPDYARIKGDWIPKETRDPVGESLLQAVTSLARKEKIVLFADGLQRKEQIRPLISAGVGYGLGPWIGDSAEKPPPLDPVVTDRIRQEIRRKFRGTSGSLAELVEPVHTFSSRTPVSEIARQFETHRESHVFVIVENGQPVGLVMREKLHRMLASQFGLPLYGNRPVAKIMETQPLVADQKTPIDQLSQAAMMREPDKLYDSVIVTDAGKVKGIVSIRALLEWVTNVRMADAQWANPLTGLPGNEPIRRELSRRLDEGRPFSVIYADLDHFKGYNDRYGFHRGDDVIRFTGETLQSVVKDYCPDNSFVGHIGGDDFIVIMDSGNPVKISEDILVLFEKGISSFIDGTHGPVADRSGMLLENTGVSISLALLLCQNTDGWTPDTLAERAALLKKKAKSRSGNSLEWDMLDYQEDQAERQA
ncbi:EAL domain-containing protein [Cohnella pontilimi]|uniref:EAL domain-containing protein n=1 Tax=Cohnella pontilimi TaxID=2564100 RepID=A0A4U0F530_9BACL|nr:EAL domain-containing protein [Cohnella pontilimi]TJY39701.1 EAL domain-containing protein [Cohnella pontilimi]